MEKVIDTFRIKGRGMVAIFKLEHPLRVGDCVTRLSDGAQWRVSGIECRGRLPRVGEIASVLFDRDADPHAGEEELERL